MHMRLWCILNVFLLLQAINCEFKAFRTSLFHQELDISLSKQFLEMKGKYLVAVILLVGTLSVGMCSNGWIRAHATYYGVNDSPASLGGACGYDNPYHAGFGAHTAALSGALFKSGESCGGCYQVRCDFPADPKWCLRGAAVTVTATNFCPSNNNNGWCNLPRHHFDMSSPAFFRIARRGNEGIVPVFYRRVGCKRRGGVRFTMRGQGNFNMVMISNVGGGGSVRAVAVRGSNGKTWLQMTRNWGANWQSSGDLRGQRLSFRVTLIDRKTLTFLNVVPSSWWFGQTFSSRGRQFV
ncbi:PREDICTED: expansin-A12 [Camelina sativa]|uniref:Expansin n=1 Tax=Camelina sativa TaxID=90675 RepID=A0ABM0YLL9_CAMSA|nr:PREDICTED: expansin-A12 [Camelina sativa]